MKKVIAFFKGWDYCHYICIGMTVAFVCVTVFCFLSSVFRLFDAAESFGTSIAYYFCTLCGFPDAVTPTVTQMPSASVEWFPSSFTEFRADWNTYWQTWAHWETVSRYFISMSIFMENAAKILLIVSSCVLVFVLVFKLFGKKYNNDYAKDSRPLRLFKRATAFYPHLKSWLSASFCFVRDNRAYWITWLCLLALDFNFFSVVTEAIAFYLYFCVSFDFGNLYVQVYKLIVDLSVLSRLPLIVWFGVILFALSRWRRAVGYRRLMHREMNNRGFINERPIVTLFVGTMGAKKTTTLTDFALSREVMFKDKAYELLLANDIENNPLAGSFEFGVVVVTEFAKERGNMLTNKKYKADYVSYETERARRDEMSRQNSYHRRCVPAL